MLGAVEGTLEADKRELTRIINEKKDDEGWATFRDVKRSKKAFTDERLRELCDKYPEELACEKRHKGYVIRLVE